MLVNYLSEVPKMKRLSILVMSLISLLLAACGDGGSDDPAPLKAPADLANTFAEAE